MKNRIIKNYFYNLSYQILNIVIPIITIPYLSRVLGAEGIGNFSFDLSIVTYFILLAGLGTANYGQRLIAKYQDDINNRTKVFYDILFLRTISFLIVLFIYIFVFCVNHNDAIFFRILTLEIISNILDISWFFQGIEEFKKILIRNLLIKIISLFTIFIFVKSNSDLYLYFIIYVLSNLFGNITFWINIKKYLDKSSFKRFNIKEHLKPTIMMFIPQIAVSIYTVLDKTMLGILCNNYSEVGFYDQSQKIIKISLTIVTAMSTVMIPRISNSYAKQAHDKISKYMKYSFDFMWFLALPICFGIIGIAHNMVPWFFGNGYDKVIDLLKISSYIIIFISCSTIIGSQYLMSINKPLLHSIAVICGAILNVLFNLILIGRLGSIGAVISTCIAEGTICMIEIVFVLKMKKIDFNILLNGFPKPFISSIIMLYVLLLLDNYFSSNIINTFILIVIAAFVYFVCLLILKYDYYKYVIKIFNKKLKKGDFYEQSSTKK